MSSFPESIDIQIDMQMQSTYHIFSQICVTANVSIVSQTIALKRCSAQSDELEHSRDVQAVGHRLSLCCACCLKTAIPTCPTTYHAVNAGM